MCLAVISGRKVFQTPVFSEATALSFPRKTHNSLRRRACTNWYRTGRCGAYTGACIIRVWSSAARANASMSNTISHNSVVTFHYTLRDGTGDVLEASSPDRSVTVLQGHANIVRGLDSALLNHVAGETFSVTVPPELGYGLRRDGWVQRISKKHLPKRDPNQRLPLSRSFIKC